MNKNNCPLEEKDNSKNIFLNKKHKNKETKKKLDNIKDQNTNILKNKKNSNNIKSANLSFVYIIDDGKFFKNEIKESLVNSIKYYCYIQRNSNKEIYFYHFIKYNINIEDNIYYFSCNDLKCHGLISLNYDENNDNYEKNDIIQPHTISYEKHEYIKYPTYGYKIYMDAMIKYDILNNIQLVREDLKNKKCYENLRTIINKINKNRIDAIINDSDTSSDISLNYINVFGFETINKEKNITIKYKNIYEKFLFIKNCYSISFPCILTNKIYIQDILKKKNNTNSIELPKTFFQKLKEKDIEYINAKSINKIYNSKEYQNSIIFNSCLIKLDEGNDKILFTKIHNYNNKFANSSNISDFCLEKEIYFPNYYNNIYYQIKLKYTHIFRIHNLYKEHGKILYHFGINGVGKSLCGRAIIFIYLNTITNEKYFFPTIFFDLNLWSSNKSEYILHIL